jgi:hypothetical protein
MANQPNTQKGTAMKATASTTLREICSDDITTITKMVREYLDLNYLCNDAICTMVASEFMDGLKIEDNKRASGIDKKSMKKIVHIVLDTIMIATSSKAGV